MMAYPNLGFPVEPFQQHIFNGDKTGVLILDATGSWWSGDAEPTGFSKNEYVITNLVRWTVEL